MKQSVRRIGLVASREFLAAVMNKGFIVGLLMMPAILALLIVVFPRVLDRNVPPIRGEVAVIDPTGQVAARCGAHSHQRPSPTRRRESATRALQNTPAAVRDAATSNAAMERAIGIPPQLTIVERPASTDLQHEKQWLTEPGAADRLRHLALIVVQPDAVVAAAGNTRYGSYELFIPENIDDRLETELYDAIRESLVAARIRAHNLNRDQVEAVMSVRRAASVTVAVGKSAGPTSPSTGSLPFAFAGLLVFGIMIGGQTLLTQTVEEKSNRVIEVLLSAVSPIELMAGKILGQMAVSMLVLAIYIGLGLLYAHVVCDDRAARSGSDRLSGPVLPRSSFLLFAAVFSAVGAAVNEMREAQSLMTPVMLVLMAPWMFATVIGREPNSTFSVALSFIPPVNTFAMMIRLASATPPPTWQVLATMVVGLAAACGVTWFAAKVFKVGLADARQGTDMATLMRWAKQA